MFPRNENQNEGTFAKTTLLRNRPFIFRSYWLEQSKSPKLHFLNARDLNASAGPEEASDLQGRIGCVVSECKRFTQQGPQSQSLFTRSRIPRSRTRTQTLEEDKRATTNVQNGLVLFFLFSYKKALILRKVLREKF